MIPFGAELTTGHHCMEISFTAGIASRSFSISGLDYAENFVILAVPTPRREGKRPWHGPVESASKIVRQDLKKGTLVVLESTVVSWGNRRDHCPHL